MDQGKLREVARLYFQLKTLILTAEEKDPEFRDFLPPLLEQRAALDHLVRAHAAELGMKPEARGGGYITSNLDKSLGHLYRAYFDAADWLSLSQRQLVVTELSPYSNGCISRVIPDYYPRIRPALGQMDQEIADIRARKDVDNTKTPEEYADALDELDGLVKGILPKLGALEECERKRRAEVRRSNRRAWSVGIVCAIVGGIVGAVVGFLLKA